MTEKTRWSTKKWLDSLTPEMLREMEAQISSLIIEEGSGTDESGSSEFDLNNKVSKATFYFPEPLIDKLEEVYITTRRINRKRVSKSAMVQQALEIYLGIAEELLKSLTKKKGVGE